MPAVADILIPLALDTAYSYAVPPGLTLAAGDVVQVPLGPRETIGVVWGVEERASGGNLRPVTGRYASATGWSRRWWTFLATDRGCT